jgi:hypothetical protein
VQDYVVWCSGDLAIDGWCVIWQLVDDVDTLCHDWNLVPAAWEERKGNRIAVIAGDQLPSMLIFGFVKQSINWFC